MITRIPTTPLLVGLTMVLIGCSMSGCSAWLDRVARQAHQEQIHDRASLYRAQSDDQNLSGQLDHEVRYWDRWQRFDLAQRLEWMSFDWRMRRLSDPQTNSQEMGLVVADDTTIRQIAEGLLPGEHWDLLWPRWPVYGRVLRELRAQKAKAVAFDVLMPDRRYSEDAIQVAQPGEEPATLAEEPILLASDEAFGVELAAEGSPVFLAVAPGVVPTSLFQTNATRLGDVVSPQDADGVARRVRAYTRYQWIHPNLIRNAAELRMVPRLLPNNRVRLTNLDTRSSRIANIDPDGSVRIGMEENAPRLQVYETRIVWHLGIVMAAAHLGLDLESAEIQPNRVLFKRPDGLQRVLPTDPYGYFHVAWLWNVNQTNQVLQQNLTDILSSATRRAFRLEDPPDTIWEDKTVLIGSFASGNNLADRGATPLEKSGFLVTLYMNVAHMLLRDQYVTRCPWPVDVAIIGFLGCLSAVATWRLPTALSPIVLLGATWLWLTIASLVFSAHQLWLPIAHPILGGLVLPYLGLTSYRVLFEQREQQRVRSLFAKMVSPDIVQEVLESNVINLGGARREITVFFADIRGFTTLTDREQADAEQRARDLNLTAQETEALFEEQAHRVLQTVNLYLATIADIVKVNQGTLDKYIGDCVMAFWGAPTFNPNHAIDGLRAAIQAQRAIHQLNESRAEENHRILAKNRERRAAGQPPLPPLATLQLGTGINTGMMTVGLMGSDSHIVNYTVFGREVNLASRLEGVSGHSRIVFGENTYRHIQRLAPEWISICNELPPVEVKGLAEPVRIFEANWREADRLL